MMMMMMMMIMGPECKRGMGQNEGGESVGEGSRKGKDTKEQR
jgi:hypothetical protein